MHNVIRELIVADYRARVLAADRLQIANEFG
jgi:hypothetical protein